MKLRKQIARDFFFSSKRKVYSSRFSHLTIFLTYFYQEEEARKKEEEEQQRLAAAEAAAANDVDNSAEDPADASGTEGGKKGSAKKKNMKKKKSSAQRKNTSKKSSSAGNSNVDLTQKVYTTMEKHKEVFFTIRLHSAQSAASLSPICDPDVPMVSKKKQFLSAICLHSHF